MATIVQVNLRAPEGDKAVLADVAARLREGGGFAERLSAFLAAEGAGAAWVDRLEAIERRLEALEAAKGERGANLPVNASSSPRAAVAPAIGCTDDAPTDIEGQLKPAPDDPVEPAGAAVTAWTTGSGKGTKLTDAGQREVLRLHGEAVSNAEIGRRVGVSGTSVANFLKRYDGAREEPLSG